jgi:hypothetical protein
MFKRIIRYLIYSISVLVFLFCLAAALSIVFKDRITSFLLNELNKRLQTEIKVKSVDFSIMKKFPYASLEFKSVYAKGSTNCLSNDIHVSNDTLFKFQSLFLEFSIYDLFSKKYVISKIHAINGTIDIARDEEGNFNYLIWKNVPASDTNKLTIKLRNVKLTNIKLSFSDCKYPKQITLDLNSCLINCSLSAPNYEFSSRFNGKIDNIQFDSVQFKSKNAITGAINLNILAEKTILENSVIKIAGNTFSLNGIFDSKIKSESKLNFKTANINIENALFLLPERIREPYSKLNLKGNLALSGTVNYSKLNSPELELSFRSIKSLFSFDYANITFSSLNLNGTWYLNSSDSSFTNKIIIKHVTGKIDGDQFEGAVSIIKSNSYIFDVNWIGNSSFNLLNKLISNDTLKQISGNFNGHLAIKGNVKSFNSITKSDFAHFLYKGELNLGEIKILKPELLLNISDFKGKLIIDKDVIIDNAIINYKENLLSGSGRIENFLPWLLTSNQTLRVHGDLKSKLFNLNKVLSKNTHGNIDTSSNQFPDFLNLELEIKFNEFISGKFRAQNVAGKITYKPRLFDLRSLYFETMEGNLTGSAIFLQKPDDHFIFKTQTLLDKVNITELFSTFDNFGQSVIDSGNIKGKISGVTNFSSEWNNSLSIIPSTIIVDGAFKIENGELIEYEPLKGLSRFINVEELKHIYFSTLQNNIFIRNRKITIPQMEVNSTNFDLIASGTHDFDNNFNYKIKVRLSEALYKRAKKSQNQMDEYGIIETEGSRKISLPLTVKGNIDNYKISYDTKQAAVNMMQNLKNEKQQLKSLLNEEFGLFKNDSINIMKKGYNKKDNFLIEWDNENYQAGKKKDVKSKLKTPKLKGIKESKDTSKIKIQFE